MLDRVSDFQLGYPQRKSWQIEGHHSKKRSARKLFHASKQLPSTHIVKLVNI